MARYVCVIDQRGIANSRAKDIKYNLMMHDAMFRAKQFFDSRNAAQLRTGMRHRVHCNTLQAVEVRDALSHFIPEQTCLSKNVSSALVDTLGVVRWTAMMQFDG
jgi:hypothetical protein